MSKTADRPATLQEYLELAYPITLTPEPEGGFTAEAKDLPGCITQGETAEEALENVEEAKALWLETALESGAPIPLPSHQGEFSGRFVVRMPKSLHRQLSWAADEEGVSLNHLVVSRLTSPPSQEALEMVLRQEIRSIEHKLARIEQQMKSMDVRDPQPDAMSKAH